jgi:hypothetical protein
MTAAAPSTRSHVLAAVWRATLHLLYIKGAVGHDAFSGKTGNATSDNDHVCLVVHEDLAAGGSITLTPSLFAIPKASNPEHAAENARAGELPLTARAG